MSGGAKSNAGRVGVWGASGSGKSSYVKLRLRGKSRVVVFDPLGEYSSVGFRPCNSVAAVQRAMVETWPNFRLSLVPTGGGEARKLSKLADFLLAVQEPYRTSGKGAPLTLVVEEMNTCFPVSGGAANAPFFADICSRGRHYGIEVFGVSQRIAEVDMRFRGNCNETVVFRQKGPRDTRAAAAELGCEPGRVSVLENLHYLHEAGGTITPDRVTFAKKQNR